MAEIFNKKEAKAMFEKLQRLALKKDQLADKPKIFVAVMEHFDETGLDFLSAWGHIDYQVMMENCFYQSYAKVKNITHRYVQPKIRKVGDRSYSQYIFCNENDKSSKPITIAQL